jgi:hypothetical protein
MFWLIENQHQLEEFSHQNFKEVFVEIIPYHNYIHPALNKVSLVYIRPLSDHKGYMLCIDHSESTYLGKTYVDKVLQHIDTIYVRDKKSFLYYFQLKKVLDISSIKSITPPTEPVFDFFYRQYPNKTDVNRIIPIVKHYEICENIYQQLEQILLEPKPDYVKFYDRGALAFFGIEKNGIKIDKDRFYKYYEPNNDLYSIHDDVIYTQYNLNTTTRRPSNAFNSINFAALKKDNNSRTSFIPKNHEFIEIDISAYHPTLAGQLVNYTFSNPDIHGEFAKMYGVDYNEAKQLTFKQLYGGVFKEYQHLEFFQKTTEFITNTWKTFTTSGKVIVPISGYYFTNQLPDMNPQKLFNYMLQNLETSVNINILLKIHKLLARKKTQIVLYTYDSFLFDVDQDEKEELLTNICDIFKELKLGIKINHGATYNF